MLSGYDALTSASVMVIAKEPALNIPRPIELADGLLLLIEGAYAISQTLRGASGGPGHALLAPAEPLWRCNSDDEKLQA